MTHILVAGGAGYIGSHACKVLKNAGYVPVTYDNLTTGWADAVKFGPLEVGDLRDRDRLRAVFHNYKPQAIMHFAADSQVGESMMDPGKYWDNNVGGAVALLQVAAECGCKNIVFSSTCATYGEQDNVSFDENSAQSPINAYGASKRAVEDMLRNFETAYGMRHVIFRYFNVAGCDPDAEIGEFHDPETHLVPVILDTLIGKRDALTIFGTDYETHDGTCIRDYVHVVDLVKAHVAGLQWLENGQESRVFNLGTGTGFTVREVIEAARRVTNRDIKVQEGPRRPGDCTRLVSGSSRAKQDLGWQAERSDIETMIKDAWRWHQTDGYKA